VYGYIVVRRHEQAAQWKSAKLPRTTATRPDIVTISFLAPLTPVGVGPEGDVDVTLVQEVALLGTVTLADRVKSAHCWLID
jgi:hypothetical protein